MFQFSLLEIPSVHVHKASRPELVVAQVDCVPISTEGSRKVRHFVVAQVKNAEYTTSVPEQWNRFVSSLVQYGWMAPMPITLKRDRTDRKSPY